MTKKLCAEVNGQILSITEAEMPYALCPCCGWTADEDTMNIHDEYWCDLELPTKCPECGEHAGHFLGPHMWLSYPWGYEELDENDLEVKS